MKIFRTMKLFAAFTIALFSIASCSSTEVLSSWSLSSPPADVMDKVIVLSVMQDMQQKNYIEQAMVSELNKAGVNASAATSLFGPKGFNGLSEDQVANKLKGSNFTSVMIVSLINKERESRYVPGTRYSSPRIVGYSRYYRRYLVIYDEMYTPGYYTTNTNYVLEADIYTVNDDDELVYSAQTRSYDPESVKSLAESFSKAIVEELKTKGIIR